MKHTLAHPPRQTSSVFSRRVVSTLLAYASLCAVAVLPTQVQADTYPSKPITLVVPNPPGGLLDTSARLLSDPLARATGQSVVVDNKPGGSGNLAYSLVARSPKDGYTVLVSYSGYHIANPILMDKLPWELTDLTPVGLITVATNVIAALAKPSKTCWLGKCRCSSPHRLR